MNEQGRNKTHNLSLKTIHVTLAGRRIFQFEVKCIKHLWNNYKYINFLNVPENSLKTLLFWFQLWFLSRTEKALHREETNKVEALEGKILH